MRRHRCVLLGMSLLAFTATGCGGDAEAPADQRVTETPATDPLQPIPPEELYGASPAENLWSPRIELEMPGLAADADGVRIAILSDFQLGQWDGNVEVAAAAVSRAVAANPDLVVMLGDYLARGDDVGALERVLQPLRGQAAVAVLGDHDIRTDSVEARVVGALERVGARVLRNATIPLNVGGTVLNVAGVDPEILASGWGEQEYVIGNLAVPGSPALLLTHAPPLAARAPEGRFPVILGGNTFCGSVEVPGTPRLSWLREEALPGAVVEEVERLFRVDGSTLVVTCGTGYGFVPLRFGAAPEVPILTLLGVSAAASGSATEESLPPTAADTTAG